MTLRRRSVPGGDGCALISPEDLALCVLGPWHPSAGVSGDKPLWNPRTGHERLLRLWALHQDLIEDEALKLGVSTIWVADRIEFVLALNGQGD
ncbi:MAG: hypothetical protein H0W08_24320 [Acidobacteria bacterium]|nr:hypothetical protein [Acidobacteriota bacterium]